MGCYRLFREGYVTELIHIYVVYGDKQTEMSKGTVRINVATNLYPFIIEHVEKLFASIVNKNCPIRKLGYDFCELQPSECERYDMFTDMRRVEKEKKLVKQLLNIQDRFGKNAVLKGIDLKENATQRDRNNKIGGHNSE